ncbi:hypothetical protein [Dolosigranulum pigrum]|uniref:Uncharacterized protein n=1 Tax=Dolosigranulum pigrum TaxID=29394 RepID=A0A516GL27_9LACT|nr:hypothetical protein [Dolosigranulum pigrum]QDO92140.1 hypothetical protein FNV33_09100 [Dolosigranulum pigrum]QDO92205.1 hypothetical protein FNV33_09455 [Dolosigranulum pigrum]QDO92270.1 hypothetical protein FNV33_09810 [Dolosigranulum pigrum]
MNKEHALLIVKRYSISIIKGYYEFKDVKPVFKKYVTRCLDNHGFGHRVDEDYRKIYEAEYGSKKNEKEPEAEAEKETETSEEPQATESEETTEE